MEIILLIAVPLVAGLVATLAGNISNTVYKLGLALSGAFVLAMCFLHLLPHAYHVLLEESAQGVMYGGIGILAGFVIQIGLEWLTGGIEHGHVHLDTNEKFPIGLLLGLCIHAFIEGFPLHDHGHDHDHHLLSSVLVHKFPVALILVVALKSYKLSMPRIWLYLIIFTLMAPLGVFASQLLEGQLENISYTMTILTCVVIGVLLHISTTILYEAGENHKYNAAKVVMILIGFVIAYFASM